MAARESVLGRSELSLSLGLQVETLKAFYFISKDFFGGIMEFA